MTTTSPKSDWAHPSGKTQAPGKVSFPLWARLFTLVFVAATGLLALAVPFAALGLVDHVIEVSDDRSVWTFAAVAALCLAVGLALDMARSYALQALHVQHLDFAARAEAGLGIVLSVFLIVIHPLMVTGILVMAGLAFLSVVALERYQPAKRFLLPLPREVKSLLSGHDPERVFSALQRGDGVPPLLQPSLRFARALAFLASLAIGAHLAIEETVTAGGMIAGGLLTLQVAGYIAGFARNRFTSRLLADATVEVKDSAPIPRQDPVMGDEEDLCRGVRLHQLSVNDAQTGRELLAPVSVDVARGQIIGITGEAGGGKSLLLKAMVNRMPKPGLVASGTALFDARDMRDVDGAGARLDSYLVPTEPILLPGSAVDNLLGFDASRQASEAVGALARMDVLGIFAEKILTQEDVFSLSASQAQIVSLARAFASGAKVLLLDMPETHLTPRALKALQDMIHVETGHGTTFVMATNHPDLLRRCDELLILEDGFLTDRGQPEEVLSRRNAGWSRITLRRDSAEEPRLHRWLQSHFRRRSDDENLRYARLLLSEMLALSSTGGTVSKTHDADELETVSFDFRHIKHACNIVMRDHGEPLSASQLQQAERADGAKGPVVSALREIMNLTAEFEHNFDINDEGDGMRSLRVALELDDARAGIYRKRGQHAKAG